MVRSDRGRGPSRYGQRARGSRRRRRSSSRSPLTIRSSACPSSPLLRRRRKQGAARRHRAHRLRGYAGRDPVLRPRRRPKGAHREAYVGELDRALLADGPARGRREEPYGDAARAVRRQPGSADARLPRRVEEAARLFLRLTRRSWPCIRGNSAPVALPRFVGGSGRLGPQGPSIPRHLATVRTRPSAGRSATETANSPASRTAIANARATASVVPASRLRAPSMNTP